MRLPSPMGTSRSLRLFLSGDVMTGRGVDQVLPHPCHPAIQEPYVRDAREYVVLAEGAHGPVERPVPPSYVWGDALHELARMKPDARIVNLETSVTARGEPWPGKMVTYRMSPENLPCLAALRPDVCALANNHVLDFGYEGLHDTIDALTGAGIGFVGAGGEIEGARRPTIVPLAEGAIVVVSVGATDSGIPWSWRADEGRAGVSLLSDFSDASADAIAAQVREAKRGGHVGVVSIHWGSNWGCEVPPEHVRFAHRLIDGGVDLVHGHSSHHPRPIEVYREKLVLYGAGDFIDDYEGIGGYEDYRPDLALMYFADLERESGALTALRISVMQIHRIRLRRASSSDVAWSRDALDRVGAPFGTRVELEDGMLALRW